MTGVKHSDYEELVDTLLNMYRDLLVPFMTVRRDMPFPTENGRPETDSEHVFTLGMIAITVAERMGLKLDTGKIAKYVLVHDLVEAYAGDVSARSPEYHQKHIKEAEALDKVRENYQEFAPWIIKYLEAYEAKVDEESRFVYAIDKCMGGLTRMADNGEFFADYYPEPDGSLLKATNARLRKKAVAHPEALKLFDAVYGELENRRPGYLEKAKK